VPCVAITTTFEQYCIASIATTQFASPCQVEAAWASVQTDRSNIKLWLNLSVLINTCPLPMKKESRLVTLTEELATGQGELKKGILSKAGELLIQFLAGPPAANPVLREKESDSAELSDEGEDEEDAAAAPTPAAPTPAVPVTKAQVEDSATLSHSSHPLLRFYRLRLVGRLC
jgi:hypothetical protein